MLVQKALRDEQLQSYTKDEKLLNELSAYTANAFYRQGYALAPCVFADEPQVAVWENYVAESNVIGVYQTLKKYLVQFHFPIKEGISTTDDYKNATLKGFPINGMHHATGLMLKEPDQLKLFLHPSIAGKIPVLIAPNPDDFQALVRALSYRNEPRAMPQSMGAAIIQGLNNWDRLTALKQKWQSNIRASSSAAPPFLNNKSLYQDRIIILSNIPYSNVSAKEMNLNEAEWLAASLQIRLHHECAHYFTLRFFGKMANNMHDELIADYMGIRAVLPSYNAKWFLKFIGLENYPTFRTSGRLNNYLGEPPLSVGAFEILQTIVKQAADNIERFDKQIDTTKNDLDRQLRILSLCKLDLIEIASENSPQRLSHLYHHLQVQL